MSLLGTAAALETLRETANAVELDGRVTARLSAVQSIFGPELAYIEAELAKAASDGERPAIDAAAHLVDAGGKRVRPLTVLLSAACFGPLPPAARELAVVAEFVHTATLLHDDVIDDSPERRGKAAARTVWGNAVSVLAGDLLLTHALDRTFVAAPAALPELLSTLRRLVDGEVLQLRGRAKLDVSEVSYFRILEGKTASLFGWSARAGAIVAGARASEKQALGLFGERLGIAFQLVDDELDYAGDSVATGKILLADLVEGKVTLPLVLALSRDPSLGPLLSRAREGEREAAEQLGSAVLGMGVCAEVRRRAAAETDRALAALTEVRPSPARDMLRILATELTNRSR
ncbi:MAG TPA: polyprenyl synthetase family protein [Polyangiaceae bacterium]|jgi:octaprenyl-diphosphate synthase|nr:polyprenyl synthetase family protein [Polyangiaceae bacterium]